MRWLNGIYVIAKKVADFTHHHQGGINMGEKPRFQSNLLDKQLKPWGVTIYPYRNAGAQVFQN